MIAPPLALALGLIVTVVAVLALFWTAPDQNDIEEEVTGKPQHWPGRAIVFGAVILIMIIGLAAILQPGDLGPCAGVPLHLRDTCLEYGE